MIDKRKRLFFMMSGGGDPLAGMRLLDLYPGAEVAFSMFKLKTEKDVPVLRLRKPGSIYTDIYAEDIGPITLESRTTSGLTLSEWLTDGGTDGSADAYAWLNQGSGIDLGNDGSPLSFASAGGILRLKNNTPAIYQDDTVQIQRFRNTPPYPALNPTNSFSVFTVAYNNAADSSGTLFASAQTGLPRFTVFANSGLTSGTLFQEYGVIEGINKNVKKDNSLGIEIGTNQQVAEYHRTPGVIPSGYFNNTPMLLDPENFIPHTDYGNSRFQVGVSFGSTAPLLGGVQEIIIYPSNQEVNRAAIYNNIHSRLNPPTPVINLFNIADVANPAYNIDDVSNWDVIDASASLVRSNVDASVGSWSAEIYPLRTDRVVSAKIAVQLVPGRNYTITVAAKCGPAGYNQQRLRNWTGFTITPSIRSVTTTSWADYGYTNLTVAEGDGIVELAFQATHSVFGSLDWIIMVDNIRIYDNNPETL